MSVVKLLTSKYFEKIPVFLYEMWKTFTCENDIYMLKIEDDNNNNIKITLCNFKGIWTNSFTLEQLLLDFQKHNQRLELPKEKLHELISNLPENLETCEILCSILNNQFVLSILSNFSTLKVKYEFSLNKSDDQEFTEKITYPMIYTVKYLEDQNRLLTDLLQKKDREIEEYKLEHGEISRTDLRTEQFRGNDAECKNKNLCLNVFNQSKEFWKRFLDLYGAAKFELSDVKKDPWNHQKKKRKTYSKDTKKTKGLKLK